MKRSLLLVIVAILLVGSILLGSYHMDISVADPSVPNNEVTSREVNNASITATITITMYAVDDASGSDTETATVMLRAKTVAGK